MKGGWLRVASAIAIGGTWWALTAAAAGAQAVGPGNPVRGRELFGQKGCIRCHSVWGQGGTLGPDIAVAVARKTWDELVGDFWNHTPRMIDDLGQRGYPWPLLDADEMADTLSYLYYLQLIDQPGDTARGADTFRRLDCAACHMLGGRGGAAGGPLDRFSEHLSPMPLATAMWNAGPRMRQEQLGRGRPIVRFTGSEMSDLQAYIRSEGRRKGREVTLQPLPSPDKGAVVYRAKQCGACHDRAGGGAPDPSRATRSRTMSETTGFLWNHSYAMGEAMAARGVAFPRFAGSELADLIAYLYFRGYLGEAGDAAAGAGVFRAKGCGGCHKDGAGSAAEAPAAFERVDQAALASAMWNHAPQALRLMAEQGTVWPQFEPGEMRDLSAYLETVSGKKAPAAR